MSGRLPWPRVPRPDVGVISQRLYRHSSQSCRAWIVKFSQALADDSPFKSREFVEGNDAATLATDILTLDQEAFSAAFRLSPASFARFISDLWNAALNAS